MVREIVFDCGFFLFVNLVVGFRAGLLASNS